ncbi:MAG: tyrosine--tRNA ligase [Myxococcales bacterium]|nr:MAG: tyrosine--tRNA ligase [Myxococcales bacterium]
MQSDLEARLRSSKALKIKAGFDPTRPDLHLGHAVLLRKMRQFQEFGHEVIFVVGDFTAQIGDPSGRSATRPVVSPEEIKAGAESYAAQASKILDPSKTKLVYNNNWLGKMNFADVIRLAGKYTLARMMERDDFKNRWAEHTSISIHELLYPLAQAYDSVHLECDVELGGTDQLFNLLVGRDLMREFNLKPQIVMTTPILEGINAQVVDGKIVGQKMSKSLDNYIGLTEAPFEQFGKVMSLSDALMWRYYELLSERPSPELAKLKKEAESGERNPRDCKIELGKEIVTCFHSASEAEVAVANWMAQFSQKQLPTDMPEVQVDSEGEPLWVPKVLVLAGLAKSSSDGRRRLEQGGVEVDGARVTDPKAVLVKGQRYIIKAGKRSWAAVTIK